MKYSLLIWDLLKAWNLPNTMLAPACMNISIGVLSPRHGCLWATYFPKDPETHCFTQRVCGGWKQQKVKSKTAAVLILVLPGQEKCKAFTFAEALWSSCKVVVAKREWCLWQEEITDTSYWFGLTCLHQNHLSNCVHSSHVSPDASNCLFL